MFVKKNIKSEWIVIDGCKSGWIIGYFENKTIIFSYVNCLSQLDFDFIKTVYIDMPVDLPQNINDYPRPSDLLAKKKLQAFHASIFYAPVCHWLDQPLSTINTQCSQFKKPKLSVQSYNLFAKCKQVQNLSMLSKNKLFEIHPELLVHYFFKEKKLSKRTKQGQLQRLNFIRSLNPSYMPHPIEDVYLQLKNVYPSIRCGIDDIVDVLFVASLIDYKNLFSYSQKHDKVESDELKYRFSIFKHR